MNDFVNFFSEMVERNAYLSVTQVQKAMNNSHVTLPMQHTRLRNHITDLIRIISKFSDFLMNIEEEGLSLSNKRAEDRMIVVYLGLDQLEKNYSTILSTVENLK